MEVISNESQNKHLKRNGVFVETEMGFNRGEKDSSNNRKALCVLHSGCGLQSNRQNVHLIK